MIRVTTLVVVLGLVVVGAACGGEDAVVESTVAPTTSVAEATTALPTDLDSLLLGASDVGEGWTATTDLSVEDLGSMAESPCQDVAVNPTIVERLRPTVGVIFKPSDGSRRGLQQLLLEGDATQMAADLEGVFGVVESCTGVVTTTPDGEKVEYQPFEIPEVGDQRWAVRVTAFEPPDFQTTWRGHMAIVRVDGVVMMVKQFEILPSPDDEPVMGDAEFVALLQLAADKLSS